MCFAITKNQTAESLKVEKEFDFQNNFKFLPIYNIRAASVI